METLFEDAGVAASTLGATSIRIRGNDPALPTRFALAENAASVLGAVGGMAAILWQQRGGEPQQVDVDVQHTAAALNSFRYHHIIGGLDPAELFAALAWFTLMMVLMLGTRSIWDCIVAHMVTNFLLGVYVLVWRDWWLW